MIHVRRPQKTSIKLSQSLRQTRRVHSKNCGACHKHVVPLYKHFIIQGIGMPRKRTKKGETSRSKEFNNIFSELVGSSIFVGFCTPTH